MIPNTNDIETFYNNYTTRQKKSGINIRHKIIFNNLKKEGLKRNSIILEVGTGIGTLTYLLSNFLTSGKIFGTDISSKSIEIAKSTIKKKNAEFFVTNMSDFKLNSKVDFIVLADVLEHIPIENHNGLFEIFSTICNENTIVAINIPHPNYQEFLKINYPEKMQIIDQAIYSDKLLDVAYKNGFYLHKLISYSINYANNEDYQWIVFKKKNSMAVFNPNGILKKIKNIILKRIY